MNTHGAHPIPRLQVRARLLAFFTLFPTTAFAFDFTNPGGWINDGLEAAGELNPFDFSSTTTHSSDVSAPPEPAFPCDGKIIRPDSVGNFMFSMQAGGAKHFGIDFSMDGANWNVPINGAMGLNSVQGSDIPVNAGKLLLAGKTWYWRARTTSGGKTLLSKKTCKIAIEPSGGVQMLTPPVLVSPACGGQAMGNPVMFDAKPGNGSFQIFRAELQYERIPGGWTNTALLAAIDKNKNPFGVAIPLSELAKHGGKWRWHARLDTEKMPLFGNLTQGQWSSWCEFSVPVPTPGRAAMGVALPPGLSAATPAPIFALPGPIAPMPAPTGLRPAPAPALAPPPAGVFQPIPVQPNLPVVQQPVEPMRRAR